MHDGHTVVTVNNGIDALRHAETERFDLILMDIQLPHMDGLEATREIRSLADPVLASVPIIALTANAMPDSVRLCLSVGMDQVLTKPIDPLRLAQAIAEQSVANCRPARPGGGSGENTLSVRIDEGLLESLREMIGAEKVDDLIELFRVTCKGTTDEIVAAAAAKDHTKVISLAHRLKGGALNLGFGLVSDASVSLEQASKSEADLASLERLINDLTDSCVATMRALGKADP